MFFYQGFQAKKASNAAVENSAERAVFSSWRLLAWLRALGYTGDFWREM